MWTGACFEGSAGEIAVVAGWGLWRAPFAGKGLRHPERLMGAKWEVGEAVVWWGWVLRRSGSFASALRERRVRPAGSGLR